jgi:pyruvate,water dikinase
MAMINAESGGVIYSCNPMNIRDASVLINSVWGLPKAVVDGSVEPDVFVVSRSPSMAIVRKEIRVKDRKFVCFPDEGVCRMDLTGDAVSLPSITDEHAFELASMAVALEEHYGTPQDIEWAVGPDGSIYLLQCRALQQWTSGDPRAAADSASPVDAPVLARGGTTASPGAASGPVYVVKTDSDKLRFVDGAVLVTVHSLPKWAPLLSRAAAVVTEVGGVAGHLANVAREFGAPALFGVPAAAERLTNGQIVTVDADGLTIYEGRVESLLTGQKSKKNLMAGSPVYRTLERIAALVTPLTLLDPESTTFRAKNCQTLHDITRFSHEKSVHEMFSFGRERRLAERASKQLVAEVAMQWWVIDLDDGFREGVEGKFVRLEEITSIPMHALWKGVVAFPWAGPPPVDTRGLMSVLMQAQTNPALDPAVQSPYSQRNYFMISKNFCSLSSRFGFHFSTVEALVGDRAQENYVSFAFKGGAADLVRRVKRAMLVASVLEEFDFRVEVTEDNASARFEGGDERLMKDKLAVLGYLIMHTRQLDMVMANDAAIAGYRAKFIEDIRSLV